MGEGQALVMSNRKHGLVVSRPQRKAMRLLAQGLSLRETAKQVGVSHAAVKKWLDIPECNALFERELDREAEYLENPQKAAAEELGSLAGEAVETVHKVMTTAEKDSLRLRASNDVLDRVLGKAATVAKGKILHGILPMKEMAALFERAKAAGYKEEDDVIDAELEENENEGEQDNGDGEDDQRDEVRVSTG